MTLYGKVATTAAAEQLNRCHKLASLNPGCTAQSSYSLLKNVISWEGTSRKLRNKSSGSKMKSGVVALDYGIQCTEQRVTVLSRNNLMAAAKEYSQRRREIGIEIIITN